MDNYRVRNFAEYQGVPTTGAAAWDRLGGHAFQNPYEDFGSLSREQAAADEAAALYGRSYGRAQPGGGGKRGRGGSRYGASQPMGGGRGGFGLQQQKRVVVIRRQRTNYPVNFVLSEPK